MSLRLSSKSRTRSLRETAIAWFMRMNQAEPDHPDRGRFEAWLMADTSHAAMYTQVLDVWEGFNSTAQLQSLAAALEQKEQLSQQRSRNIKKSAGSVLGILLVAAVSLFGYQTWQAQPVMQLALNTATGEIAAQALPDGSKLTINTGSEVDITYYRDKRLVKLTRGEAIFEVARDEARPFVVDSGHARVTVLGTRFAVNRLHELVRVSVDHGRVLVEQQDEHGAIIGAPVQLGDGEVAEIDANGAPKRVSRPAVDAFGFVHGLVTFDQASLDEIAETLSRYRQFPIYNQAKADDDARITAVIKSADIEEFIGNLPSLAPVAIEPGAGFTVIVDQSTHY